MKLIHFMFLSIALSALSWVILTPIWQYPDEQAHFAQVQNIAESNTTEAKKNFNTSSEIHISESILATNRVNGNNKFTYHPEYNIPYTDTTFGFFEEQLRELSKSSRVILVKTEATANPPLYYFGGSFVYKLFYNLSIVERVFAIRLYSLCIYLLSTLVVFFASAFIFKKNIFSRILLTASVSFMPMYVHASTGILPDPLTNLIFSLFILVCINAINTSFSIVKLLILIFLILIGYSTRQQFLILIPIAFYALFLDQIRKKQIKRIAMVLISMLAVLSIFIKFKVPIPEIGYKGFNVKSLEDLLSFTVWTIHHTYSEVLPWYWGVYRWLSLTLPHLAYEIINRIILFSAIGGLWIVLEKIKSKKLSQTDYSRLFLLGSSLIYFIVFTLGDYFFSRQYGYSFGIQGRYFFPLIFAHMTLLLAGLLKLSTILPSSIGIMSKPFLLFLILSFNTFSLYIVARSYYDTSTFSNLMIQASQYKPTLIKGLPIILIPTLAIIAQVLFLVIYTLGVLKTKKFHESN